MLFRSIEGASVIRARLLDGRQFEGELVGSDPDFDLAILRLKGAQNLPQAIMGDSSDIMIGETIIAIGNPFGFKRISRNFILLFSVFRKAYAFGLTLIRT